MKLDVSLKDHSYPVYIEHGLLSRLNELLPDYEKIVLVSDTGVPGQWIEMVQDSLNARTFPYIFPQGEASKTLQTWAGLLEAMCEHEFDRKDAVVAIGGGVAGDLAGFAAACYMRGIDFYNIPTTVLSQVDSSVGGKTAVDLGSYKNNVGAFYQPKAVFIDPDTLSTLDERQIKAGLAEAYKMGLILDADLAAAFASGNIDRDAVIARSVELKKDVVEQDEKESSLRKILNFGHTIGHAIESASLESDETPWIHGECVAAGMLFFIDNDDLRHQVVSVLDSLGLPRITNYDPKRVSELLRHDKKAARGGVDVVIVNEAGKAEIRFESFDVIEKRLERKIYD